eukprot:g3121.t1
MELYHVRVKSEIYELPAGSLRIVEKAKKPLYGKEDAVEVWTSVEEWFSAKITDIHIAPARENPKYSVWRYDIVFDDGHVASSVRENHIRVPKNPSSSSPKPIEAKKPRFKKRQKVKIKLKSGVFLAMIEAARMTKKGSVYDIMYLDDHSKAKSVSEKYIVLSEERSTHSEPKKSTAPPSLPSPALPPKQTNVNIAVDEDRLRSALNDLRAKIRAETKLKSAGKIDQKTLRSELNQLRDNISSHKEDCRMKRSTVDHLRKLSTNFANVRKMYDSIDSRAKIEEDNDSKLRELEKIESDLRNQERDHADKIREIENTFQATKNQIDELKDIQDYDIGFILPDGDGKTRKEEVPCVWEKHIRIPSSTNVNQPPYEKGQKVEAMYRDGCWRPAMIVSVKKQVSLVEKLKKLKSELESLEEYNVGLRDDVAKKEVKIHKIQRKIDKLNHSIGVAVYENATKDDPGRHTGNPFKDKNKGDLIKKWEEFDLNEALLDEIEEYKTYEDLDENDSTLFDLFVSNVVPIARLGERFAMEAAKQCKSWVARCKKTKKTGNGDWKEKVGYDAIDEQQMCRQLRAMGESALDPSQPQIEFAVEYCKFCVEMTAMKELLDDCRDFEMKWKDVGTTHKTDRFVEDDLVDGDFDEHTHATIVLPALFNSGTCVVRSKVFSSSKDPSKKATEYRKKRKIKLAKSNDETVESPLTATGSSGAGIASKVAEPCTRNPGAVSVGGCRKFSSTSASTPPASVDAAAGSHHSVAGPDSAAGPHSAFQSSNTHAAAGGNAVTAPSKFETAGESRRASDGKSDTSARGSESDREKMKKAALQLTTSELEEIISQKKKNSKQTQMERRGAGK